MPPMDEQTTQQQQQQQNKNLLRLGTNQVRRGNTTGEKCMGAVGCISTRINFSVCLTVSGMQGHTESSIVRVCVG
jgi:hypothetical protein